MSLLSARATAGYTTCLNWRSADESGKGLFITTQMSSLRSRRFWAQQMAVHLPAAVAAVSLNAVRQSPLGCPRLRVLSTAVLLFVSVRCTLACSHCTCLLSSPFACVTCTAPIQFEVHQFELDPPVVPRPPRARSRDSWRRCALRGGYAMRDARRHGGSTLVLLSQVLG